MNYVRFTPESGHSEGGLFVFSVERSERETYQLLDTARYAQSEAYIHGLASEHNFSIELSEQILVRKGKEDNWVPGNLFILKASNHSNC